MDPAKEDWEKLYQSKKDSPLLIDAWLEKYNDILSSRKGKALDLGCGRGNDTAILLEKGFDVTSIDYSKEAIDYVKKHFPKANILEFDITNPLPFAKDSFSVIIADLSLHYFTKDKTEEILKEIASLLAPSGVFLVRVNSINDTNFGAGEGKEVENHLYEKEGSTKRFFSSMDIESFFSCFSSLSYKEERMSRYGKEKVLFEIVAYKPQ